MKFSQFYDVTVKDDNGADINVSLRFTIASGLKLKKKYKEESRTILVSAGRDDEKLVDVLTECLNWSGNSNAIKNGEELLERMIESSPNGFGSISRMQLIGEIGYVSGIFDEFERDCLFSGLEKGKEHMSAAAAEEDGNEKNA